MQYLLKCEEEINPIDCFGTEGFEVQIIVHEKTYTGEYTSHNSMQVGLDEYPELQNALSFWLQGNTKGRYTLGRRNVIFSDKSDAAFFKFTFCSGLAMESTKLDLRGPTGHQGPHGTGIRIGFSEYCDGYDCSGTDEGQRYIMIAEDSRYNPKMCAIDRRPQDGAPRTSEMERTKFAYDYNDYEYRSDIKSRLRNKGFLGK